MAMTPENLQQKATYCPEAIFTLGARLEHLDGEIQDLDQDKHLCLGSILGSTPPVWVYLDGFYMSRWMVTNGEYMKFMTHTEEDGDDVFQIYNDPELWEFVWSGQNYRLTELKMPVMHGERIENMIENYQGAESFIEAYILSIQYEVERMIMSDDEPVIENEQIEALFDYIRLRLWDMIAEEDDDSWGDEDEDMTAEQAVEACEAVMTELYQRYASGVDPRFVQALRARKFPVESILFLQRFRKAVQKVAPDEPIPLHVVLYPRYWDNPPGKRRKKRFKGVKVPWEQQPVYGLTLYEALAYTAWLSQQTGVDVTLPSEAEYERAAGWPLAPTPMSDGSLVVDPQTKSIFPWHSPGQGNFRDYNSFFGQEGRDLNGFYFANKNEFHNLMEETAKHAPDGQDIYQLMGFGWHWTRDRYDANERKYGRFDTRNYPILRSPQCTTDPGGERLAVFRYKPNTNLSDSSFVLRGSPDVVGGPGTATRRFCAYPLRGYMNVGFRFIFRQS